ncbi:MAG TPA: S8 family serine peptidase [Casimicrobiaceae bacterium]|nr:S8 family serine peptidase [Casimicrobiaceae bacterium]
MVATPFHVNGRRFLRIFLAVLLASLVGQSVYAQDVMSQAVADQIAALLQEKEARTVTQQKLDSQLWYAIQASRGKAMRGASHVYGSAMDRANPDASGAVRVRIKAILSRDLMRQITALSGKVTHFSAQGQSISATMPLEALEALAAHPAVVTIAPAPRAITNVGALTSQGYVSHKANLVVNNLHIDGTGVKVGVLSDSAGAARVAALIASGDLPADTLVVPGEEGPFPPDVGFDEGAAMMEIIHDLAPGAKLFFATAFKSPDSFADNIRMLRFTYHCDIIVDDVSYSDEGAFQDTVIADAVNDVVADGALYFSSAGNSGNLTSGNSSAWEGDFNPGPPSGAPLPAGYTLHLFAGILAFNLYAAAGAVADLQWADPWVGSTNDYDLFILNPAGTTVLCASTTVQSGVQAPFEECFRNAGYPANSRLLIAAKPGAAIRALHLDTFLGTPLTIATPGNTRGHNAGLNTVSTAATYWNSARTGTRPFVGGAANPTETFSSDGPRKIFFHPDGSAITPGNFRFATNGGTTLVKPDVVAADGVSTKTPGFLPFFGTSAAAPHAAAVAALVKSAKPTYTNAQILNAMKQTALDIRAPGIDRDSGYGIVMALEAVNYALTH